MEKTFNGLLIEDNKVRVCVYTTSEALNWLEKLIVGGFIVPEKYALATLYYKKQRLLGNDPEESYNYPLKFYSSTGKEFWLGGVTAGYGGEGPNGALKALKRMGFCAEMYEEEILTDNGPNAIVSLKIYK